MERKPAPMRLASKWIGPRRRRQARSLEPKPDLSENALGFLLKHQSVAEPLAPPPEEPGARRAMRHRRHRLSPPYGLRICVQELCICAQPAQDREAELSLQIAAAVWQSAEGNPIMGSKATFKGSITALVTPFRGGEFDEAAFRTFVDWQITNGTHGLVPVGTTGEGATLSHEEHHRVIEACIAEAKGRVPVIAGAGSNNTAEKAGADGLLVVVPYYNKPSQEGMYRHFKAVNDAVGIPIIMYNIPPRTVVDMSIDTMKRLFELPNIAGVKDATGNLARIPLQRHHLGEDFIQLSGDDMTALAVMAHGGQGCISVTSNIMPRACADAQQACLDGNFVEAMKIHDRLIPLHSALFVDPNPAGPKYALSRIGKMGEELRLPMVAAGAAARSAIDAAMKHAGLLPA
jgi:4-hydroxy-tetrahydrodipicolinate synthase